MKAGAIRKFMPGTAAVLDESGQDASAQIKAGNYGAAAGHVLRGTAALPVALADDVVGQPLRKVVAPVAAGVGNALNTAATGNSAPAFGATAPVAAAAPPVAANPTDLRLGDGTQTAPGMQSEAPITSAEPGMQPPVAAGVGGQTSADRIAMMQRAGQTYREISDLQNSGTYSEPGVMSSGAGARVVGQEPSAMFARTPAQQAQDRAFDTSVARTRAGAALRLNPGRRGAGMAREIMAGVVEPERNRVAAEGVQLREAGATQREEVRAGALRTNAAASNKIAEANLGINQARLGVEQGRAAADEQSKAALITAQNAFLNAKTPEEKAAAAQALAVLQGRVKETPDLFDRVQTGIDPATGAPVFSIYSKRTGQVQGPAGGPQAPAPGTVKNGYRFKGGNPADQKSWEKV